MSEHGAPPPGNRQAGEKMSKTLYDAIEQEVSPSIVKRRTEVDPSAEFQLGVQYALRAMRDKFVRY